MNQAESFLKNQISQNKTPGVSYYIFDKKEILYQFQGGFADLKGKKPITEHTTLNAFSITKTFTALAILQLFENGKLELDESVAKYVANFPYSTDITVNQLLTHSAGIPTPVPLSWIHLISEDAVFNDWDFFKKVFLKHNKIKFSPGEKFSYSNLGYYLLGRIITSNSGKSYRQYVRENIINKLDPGPDELDFHIHDPVHHAKGYIKQLSFSNMILGLFIDKSKYMTETEATWKPFLNYYINGSAYGGLIGTPKAFVKYIQELLQPDCKLISDKNKKLLFTENYTRANQPTGMCKSWFTGKLRGKQYYTHAGGGGGYYCEIRIYTELQMGSVIMFNRTGMKDERILDNIDKYFIGV